MLPTLLLLAVIQMTQAPLLLPKTVPRAPAPAAATPTVIGTTTPALPSISASPSSLDFGNQPVRTTSVPRAVTLVNTTAQPMTISTIVLDSDGDFAEADTCSSGPIAPGGSCAVSVTFTPLAPGSSSAVLIISDNAGTSPQSVPLTGNGLGTTIGVSPGSVDFGSQLVGITSTARTVTIINTGSLPLNIRSILVRTPVRPVPSPRAAAVRSASPSRPRLWEPAAAC